MLFNRVGWTVTIARALGIAGVLLLAACTSHGPSVPMSAAPATPSDYLIGPGDTLQISVWQNKELSTTAPVRPDGRISIPLVEDIEAAGKSPTQLAREIEGRLKKYVTDPVVTVIVGSFQGSYEQQVRVVGEAAKPQAIPYRQNMSLLDAMIAVGGETTYAAGNRATLVRTIGGRQTSYKIHIDDLLKDGDMTANVPLQPGDVIIIPQSYF